ncbi:MAG: tail fiber domain-containing protein [Bacteroidia bacterium]
MKKLTKHLHFSLFIFLIFPLSLSAQVGINGTNSDPDPSAMLDVQSTDKGLLMPRMTTAQRDSITSPATGLIIYNLDNTGFQSWNGTAWVNISSPWKQSGDSVYYNAGNVGIGTDSPTARLSLAGGNFSHTAADPVHIGSISDNGTTELAGARGIYVSGKYAYVNVWSDDGVEILDISDPANPTHVGAITDNATTELDGAQSIYVSGKYAYVASFLDDGVEILDISDPANPTHVGAITDNVTTALDGAYSLYVSGKYAYVASYVDQGIEILDISDPANPIHVGAIFDNGTTALAGAQFIYVSGKYAYVTSWIDDGVEILDISDPANPTHVGAIFDNGTTALDGAANIYVSGKYAYIAASNDDGVEILDISDPANPTHVGAITDNGATALGGAWGIYVSGKYAYVASIQEDGVEILDISDPTNPTHVGAITDNGATALNGASGLYVSGKYAYVASNTDNGVEILDISGIDAPAASIGTIATNSLDVSENARVGNDLYIGNGLQVGSGGIYAQDDIATQGRLSMKEGAVTGYIPVSDATGNMSWMDPVNVDDQTLSLSGTQLSIADGNTVNLASIDTDTDDQTLSLSGAQLGIADGNTVNLASIDTDTDDQTLSLSGTQLSIADGNTVNLSVIDTDTDDQTLSLSGTQLSIADGNTVNLASIDTDTDDQTLNLSGTQLSIADGNSVDLVSLKDNLGNHIATQNLQLGNYTLSGDGDSEGIMVTSNGNVGININNPVTPLGIFGNGGTNYVGITQNQIMGGATMELTTPDASANQATRIGISGGSNNTDIVFFSGARGSEASKMLIEGSTGFVGIGTNSPDSRLDVGGGNISMNGGYISNDGDNEGIYIDVNGNVGIGTASPDRPLKVSGNWQLARFESGTGSGIDFNGWASGVNIDPIVSGSNFYFGRDVALGKFIIQSGNVGIGTANPYSPLHIDKTLDLGTLMTLNNGGTNGANVLKITSGSLGTTDIVDIQNGAFVVEGNGNIGIGTTTPSAKLDVRGTLELEDAYSAYALQITNSSSGANISSAMLLSNDVNKSLEIGMNSSGHNQPNEAYLKVKQGDALTFDFPNGERMRIQADGNIGIGTSNPTQAKVVINGSVNNTLSYGWLNSSGNTGGAGSPTTNPYSLYASHRIAASEFNAHSDMRIKNIQGASDANEDLATLMQIEITDYTLRDTIEKGNTPQKKVIAQQVAEVYPQAVSTNLTEVIPDIYQRAEIKDGWVMLATDLKTGDRVKVILKNGSDIYEISAVENDRFQIAASNIEGETVFVYGREVNDFHTVDYEALSMLNVSATQEQQRVIEDQQAEIDALKKQHKAEIEALKAQNHQMKESFETRFQALETLLKQANPSLQK